MLSLLTTEGLGLRTYFELILVITICFMGLLVPSVIKGAGHLDVVYPLLNDFFFSALGSQPVYHITFICYVSSSWL